MNHQERIEAVAHELRSWNGVAIVGAGASLMRGFPLTAQLRPLVWQAVDSDDSIRSALAILLHRGAADAKSLIGDDPIATHEAYRLISETPQARRIFQEGFARLDAERVKQFSPTHDALAELLHRRTLETVVSFNWDTLLEAAYRRLYGRLLRLGDFGFQKPHGDAADPDRPWVLPHEAGMVPDLVVEHLTSLAMQRPRVLLIVGYSERDEEVVTSLIAPIEKRWRVVRIGPNATGESDIPLAADEALPALIRAIVSDPEVPGWEYIGFDNQRDLGAALSGRRLGAADVETCPRFPEVERVKEVLLTARTAAVTGGAGCGKSITLYQAAYDLARKGWEVIRLADPSRPAVALAAAVSNLPWRTVAIIDDAQAVDPAKLQRVLDHASEELRIVVASTQELPAFGKTVAIAAERAVKVLADNVLRRKEEVLPIVRRLDDWVGDGATDEPYEWRVQAAAESKSAWQFSFVLTGGWRRTREEVNVLRERDRADLLLAAVAARQLLLLDGEVTREWLDRAATEIGRDAAWVTGSLGELRRRQAVMGETAFRCPHLRMAEVVLRAVCERPADPEWDRIVGLLRAALQYRNPSLAGLSRLLFELWYADPFKLGQAELLDDAIYQSLLRRCWAATGPVERGGAAVLLMTLLRWRKMDQLRELAGHAAELTDWIRHADVTSAPGLASLLNDTYNDDQSLAGSIVGGVDPAIVAGWLNNLRLPETYRLTYLVDRLLIAAPQEWRSQVSTSLNRPDLLALSDDVSIEDAPTLVRLIDVVLAIDRNLALEMVSRAIPAIAGALNRSPVDAFHSMQDGLFWHALGGYPAVLGTPKPSKEQRTVARRIANALDPVAIARGISSSPRRSWQEAGALVWFVRDASSRQYRRIVEALDFEALDASAGDGWLRFTHELKVLVGALAPYPDFEPARSWIERHAAELRRVNPTLGYLSPNVVASAMRRGVKMDLEIHSGLAWGPATLALRSLGEIDSKLVSRAVYDSRDPVIQGLLLPQHNSCEHLPEFVHVVTEMAPGALETVLARVDPAAAERNWTARLRGKAVERRAAAALIHVAHGAGGAISEVAERLSARFPRAASIL